MQSTEAGGTRPEQAGDRAGTPRRRTDPDAIRERGSEGATPALIGRFKDVPLSRAIETLAHLIVSETEPTKEVLLYWAELRAHYLPYRHEESALVVFAGRLKAIEESIIADLPVPPIPALGQARFASRVLVRLAERFREAGKQAALRAAVRLARRHIPSPVPPDLGYSPSPDLYDLLDMLEAEVAKEDVKQGVEAVARAEADEAAARRELEDTRTWVLQKRSAAGVTSPAARQKSPPDSSAAGTTNENEEVPAAETKVAGTRRRPGRPTERDSEVERFVVAVRKAGCITRKVLVHTGFRNPSTIFRRACAREEYRPHLRRLFGRGERLVSYEWVEQAIKTPK